MKVLYALHHPNCLSESYIRDEIEWMQAHGVHVSIVARFPPGSEWPLPAGDLLYSESLQYGIERWKPDRIHFTWLTTAEHYCRGKIDLPVTIRGHSYDFNVNRARALLELPYVKRMWLFPHFAAQIQHPKMSPLSTCYSPERYTTPTRPGRRRILRVAAGVKLKGAEAFLEIASLVPEEKFTLVLSHGVDGGAYVRSLKPPPNVELLVNISHDGVAELMRDSMIYLSGNDDRKHPYGMPTSVAAAMASGLVILSPDVPAARAFAGDCGRYYQSTAHAAETIRGLLDGPPEAWQARREMSIERAKVFTHDRVLPTILNEWQL